MRKLISSFILLFFISQTFSQAVFEGTVYEESTKEPLVGVNVYIPDLQMGEVTDASGYYHFENLPRGVFNVQFSYIGYKTEIIEIHLHGTNLTKEVELKPSVFHSQEVVVSGGKHTAQHENAIKVETFQLQQLKENNDISMLQSLAAIPGLSVISKGSGIGTPVIRGLSTSNVLVLNNGIRMENFQFSENHPYQINEFGIDRIEVVKGPASLLYGSDAIGGVLNVIPEDPPVKNNWNGDYAIAYNTNTQGFNTNLGVKGNKNNKYAGIRLGFKSHKDYTDGDEVTVPNSRFNEQSLKLFSGIHHANFNSRLYYDYNYLRPGLTVAAVVPIVNTSNRDNNIWFQDLQNHLVGLKNKLYLNKFKIDANFSYQHNHRQLYGVETAEHFKNVDMTLNTFTADILGEYDINLQQNIMFGVQGLLQDNTNGTAPMHVLPDFKMNDFSVLGLYQYNWNERFFFQLGSRYDFRTIDVPEQEKSEHAHGEEEHEEQAEDAEHEEHEEDHLEALNTNYGNYSFSAGLTYKLTDDLLIRTNIASAYRTPNVAELTQDGIHGNRYELGDRTLKSQRNYELDVSTHYHARNVMIEVAAFYNYINDYIHLAPSADSTDEGNVIYKYIQDNSTLLGFELAFDYHPIQNLALNFSYSYVQGKKENGEYLPFIPQNKLNSAIRLSLPENIFTNAYVKIAANYAFMQNNPSIYETKTDDYLLFNLYTGADIVLAGQKFTLNLALNNILNQKYFDHLSTLKSLGYFNIGRNINVSLKTYFDN